MSGIRWIANRGFYKILLALLLIVVIMFASNYLVYRNSLSSVYEQVSENNRLVVKNMIRAFDDSFKDINNVITAINQLPYNSLATAGDGADLSDAYLMINKDMKPLISSLDYVEEVVVLHTKSDLAITTSGTIHLNDLFRLKYYNQAYNAEFWRSLLENPHPLRVFPVQGYSAWGFETGAYKETQRKLLVVAGNNLSSMHNVFVFLNLDKLLQHVHQPAMMQGSSLTMLDQDRNVILNMGEAWDLVDVMRTMDRSEAAETTLKKPGYAYHMYKSDYNNFTYINREPYQFANTHAVGDTNRNIMIVAIAFAVLLSAVLSLYLYKPMRIILKLMGGRDPREIDFRTICAGIVKLKEENDAAKAKLEDIHAELHHSAFLQALEDRYPTKEAGLRMQGHVAELLRDNFFLLAAFHLEPGGDRDSHETGNAEETLSFLQGGLSELFGFVPVFHAEPHMLLAVIGVGAAAERERTVERLRVFVRRAAWKQAAPLTAVSRLYASRVHNLRKAHHDLKACLAYRTIDAAEPLVDMQAITRTWRVYFPLDDVAKLSNLLIGGKERECIRMIDDIFARNAERRIHHHQLVHVAKMLFYELLKLLDISDADAKEVLALEAAFLARTDASLHHAGIRDALVEAVTDIGDRVKGTQKSKLNATEIARYIERSYMDNLHLEHMAERLETSPKYFSNYFKKTFGVNFVEYVNKVRLSKAKEWLRDTDLSVAEIGEKAGYLNTSTFTTTFKKYYGLSPSEYRKTAAGERVGK